MQEITREPQSNIQDAKDTVQKTLSSYPMDFIVDMAAQSERRERDQQQDRYVMRHHVMQSTASCPICMAGVFDGHGGNFVAEYLARCLPPFLFENDRDFRTMTVDELKEALEGSLDRCQNDLLQHYSGNAENCGTTAVVALIRGRDCWIANVGDSVACLYASDFEIVQCTRLHKPELPDEKYRIEKTGGEVTGIRVPRVTCRTSPARLNLSRALGDLRLREVGISSEPELTYIRLNPVRHRYLVLCSDGVAPENLLELAARIPTFPSLPFLRPEVKRAFEAMPTEIVPPRPPGHEMPAASLMPADLTPFVPQTVTPRDQLIHGGRPASQIARYVCGVSGIGFDNATVVVMRLVLVEPSLAKAGVPAAERDSK